MAVDTLLSTLLLSVSLLVAATARAQQPTAKSIDFRESHQHHLQPEQDSEAPQLRQGLSASSLLPVVPSALRLVRPSTNLPEAGFRKKFNVFKFDDGQVIQNAVLANFVRGDGRVHVYLDTLLEVKTALFDDVIFLLEHQVFPISDRWRQPNRRSKSHAIDDMPLTVLVTSLATDRADLGVGNNLTSYAWRGDLCRKSDIQASNELALVCVDINFIKRGNALDAAAAIAREYQRQVGWRYHGSEEEWLCAGVGSYLVFASGLGMPVNLRSLWQNPGNSVLSWENSQADYAASFTWMLYLAERFGGDKFVQLLVQQQQPGIAAIQAVLDIVSPKEVIQDVFVDWLLANLLNPRVPFNHASKYAYYSFRNQEGPTPTAIDFLPSPVIHGKLPQLACEYYQITGGENVVVNFAADPGSGISAKVVLLEGGQAARITGLPGASTGGIIPVPGLRTSDTRAIVLVYRFTALAATGQAGYELQISGHNRQQVFSDSLQYHDQNSRTVLTCSLPGRNFGEGLATAIAVRFSSPRRSRLTGAEFAFLEGREFGKRSPVVQYAHSDSADLPGKIAAVGALQSTRKGHGLLWRRYDFQRSDILIQEGSDFHLLLSYDGFTALDSVQAVLDTARIPSDRSHVLLDSAGLATWRSFKRGNNFFAKAIFSVVAEHAAAILDFEVAASQTVSGAFNVVVLDTDLDEVSLEGSMLAGDIPDAQRFYFHRDSTKKLRSPPLKLRPGSPGLISLSGMNRFGPATGADTLAVSAGEPQGDGACSARSADGMFEIYMPAGAARGATAFVVQGDSHTAKTGAPSSDDFTETGLRFLLVTAANHWEQPAEVVFHYEDNVQAEMAENRLVIARQEMNNWTAIGGELYREQKVIRALVDSAGTFALLVRRASPKKRDHPAAIGVVLRQNYPNPFNGLTTIRFGLSSSGLVTIRIVNLKGQAIATLASREFAEGDHSVEWDGTDDAGTQVASGVYLYQVESKETVSTRKLVLVK